MSLPSSSELFSQKALRYPGLRSYEERDQAKFCGRRAAADELFLRVLSVRLLLQFAPSGVGKTSVLSAGLFPRLRPREYFPFFVRLNRQGESLVDSVRESLIQAAKEYGLVDPVIPVRAESLRALLSGIQLWSADLLVLTPVLVFDQFEEIFSLRDAGFRAEFAREVGPLSTNTKRGEVAPPVKFILSLREEYLGKLEEFSSSIPELFRERLRLAPLTEVEAREAIVTPASLPGECWSSPNFTFSDESLSLIIDFVDGASETRVIEPLTLQLVCNHAEKLAKERTESEVPLVLGVLDFGGISGLENLVRSYYQKVLSNITNLEERKRARQMIELALLDPSGKRLMLEHGEIEREYLLNGSTLDLLVGSSLLRCEPRNERVFYEIGHDRLADTIFKQRKVRLPRWVVPTLGFGILLLVLATSFLWQQRSLTEQATAARDQAEYAVGQLLSEQLVSRLRDAGLSDALSEILERTRGGVNRQDHADGLAAVLQWRHAGDIERDRGILSEARKHYENALAGLDGMPAHERPDIQALLQAERGRVLTALGTVAGESGELNRSLEWFERARRAWDFVVQNKPRPQELLDAAESCTVNAEYLMRLGDYDGAETQALASGRLATKVWAKAYDGTYGLAFESNFDTGRAIQVFADAVLVLSKPRWNITLAKNALDLGREAVRLRPLSFQARKEYGTAIGNYFSHSLPSTSEEWSLLLVESRRLFSDSGQMDENNLTMRREEAALELLISEIVGVCAATSDCKKGIPNGTLEVAQISAIESTGTFRRLAALDRENMSRRMDIAWGLTVQAKLKSIDGQFSQSIALLDDALAIDMTDGKPSREFQWHWDHASRLMARALQQKNARRVDEAVNSIVLALSEVSGPRGETVAGRFARIGLNTEAVPIYRETGRPQKAKELQAEISALGTPEAGPQQKSHGALVSLNQEANSHSNSVFHNDDPKKRENLALIESLYSKAINEYPFDPVVWGNLSVGRLNLANLDEGGKDLEAIGRREFLLRGAVVAAWMADVLGHTDVRLRRLYEARRALAMHILNHGNPGPELLALAERGLVEAKSLAGAGPVSADKLFYLADANVGVAFTRESVGAAGWDEAIQVGLMHGEKLARIEPRNPSHRLWLVQNRIHLAALLDRDGRTNQASNQRRLALESCRLVLAIPGIDATQRAEAQSCATEMLKSVSN